MATIPTLLLLFGLSFGDLAESSTTSDGDSQDAVQEGPYLSHVTPDSDGHSSSWFHGEEEVYILNEDGEMVPARVGDDDSDDDDEDNVKVIEVDDEQEDDTSGEDDDGENFEVVPLDSDNDDDDDDDDE